MTKTDIALATALNLIRPIPKHITIEQLGSVFVSGKASTLTSQLKQLADHAMVGRVPSQHEVK